MLVHRWLILRSPLPQRFTVKKVIALVNVLAKLQNFCINELDEDFCAEDNEDDPNTTNVATATVVTATATNGTTTNTTSSHPDDNGAADAPAAGVGDIRFESDPEFGVDRPVGLLNGGNHFEDYPRSLRRRGAANAASCPRETMRRQVEDSHLVRPHAPNED